MAGGEFSAKKDDEFQLYGNRHTWYTSPKKNLKIKKLLTGILPDLCCCQFLDQSGIGTGNNGQFSVPYGTLNKSLPGPVPDDKRG